MTNTTITAKEARAILGQHYEQVLIKRNGEVHVRGRMPNSNVTGWFLYGDLECVAKRIWG